MISSNLNVNTLTCNGTITCSDTTQSVSNTSGSVVISGGLGVMQNIYVGGFVCPGSYIISQWWQNDGSLFCQLNTATC